MLGSYRDMSPSTAWAHKQGLSTRTGAWRVVKNNRRSIYLVLCIIVVLAYLAYEKNNPYLNTAGAGTTIVTAADHASNPQSCSRSSLLNPCPRIAKVTMLADETDELYERALLLHDLHNQRFGYKHIVLREHLLADDWSKPAYLQQLMVAELVKPVDERLEWLVWMPAHTTLLNPKVPLEIFLPPPNDWDHIHVLVASDSRGMNNGAMFLRVHEWTVWLMNACLATELIRPGLRVSSEDQAAVMFWLNRERFRNNVMHVPQRWFDANAGYRGSSPDAVSDPEKPQTRFRAGSARDGDLLVRHVGMESLKLLEMQRWIEFAEKHPARWEIDLAELPHTREIEAFWRNDAPKERKTQDKLNAKLAAEAKSRKTQKKPPPAHVQEPDQAQLQAQAQAQAQVEAEAPNPVPNEALGR